MDAVRTKMTYDRWEELLHRAWADGVRCAPHPTRPGCALCTSATHANVRYTVSADGCNCPAGTHHGECKHRALFLFERPDLLPHAVAAIETDREALERLLAAIGA